MAGRVVHPIYGEVEVVAGVREVVVVAPEVPHAELRGEDEPDVVVAPVGVGRVLRARIEPHDLHADRGIVRRSGQPLLERRDGCLVGDPCPRRAVDCAADVRDRKQLLDEEPGNASLLGLGRGVEPGRVEVLSGSHHRPRVLARAVVVREDEPARRDERRRAVGGEAQRTEPRADEPGRIGPKAVGFPEVVERRVVERPHLPCVEPTGLHPRGIERRHSGAGSRRRRGAESRARSAGRHNDAESK